MLEHWRQGAGFSKDWNITAPLKPLNKMLAANYPPYSQAIPDVVRAQIFLADVKQWEQTGQLPHFVLLPLPSDHTRGRTPDVHTPKAMMADTDLALGQIVAALSKTRFWKKRAIFVVQDDAQNGVDHVDGHRTSAFAISPYVRRGAVDSTFYAHQRMLKTIESILSLPTLSLFDLIAHEMRASFTDAPDFISYEAVEPQPSIFELNPPLTSLHGQARRDALASARMRFDVPDAAPTHLLNQIAWRQVKGAGVPIPALNSPSLRHCQSSWKMKSVQKCDRESRAAEAHKDCYTTVGRDRAASVKRETE